MESVCAAVRLPRQRYSAGIQSMSQPAAAVTRKGRPHWALAVKWHGLPFWNDRRCGTVWKIFYLNEISVECCWSLFALSRVVLASSLSTSTTYRQCVHNTLSMLMSSQRILHRDQDNMSAFMSKWRLQPSSSKTVCCVFHLHNDRAYKKLNLTPNGQEIRREPHSDYLGVIDRSLTFHNHLKVCTKT